MTKKIIGVDIGEYYFNPINKTITLSGIEDLFTLENLLLITNVTSNIMLYNFADSELGASILNNVITLNYDTSTMSSSDKIQIFIEDGKNQEVKIININNEIVNPASDDSIVLLRRLVKLLESNATVDVNNRQRVVVDGAVISSGSMQTVSTVSNLGLIAGIDPRFQIIDMARASYNTGARANLNFT